MSNQVAETILLQLGGRRFIAMTGSKNFLASDNALSMQLGRNNSRANRLKVILDASDTYTLVWGRFAKLDYRELERVEGVYAEDLQRFFTKYTGLDTHL